MKTKHFNHILITIAVFLLALPFSFAQQNVGIGTEDPDESAALHIVSYDQGILIPDTDTSAVNNEYDPAEGLLIYSSVDQRFFYYTGEKWVSLSIIPGAFENHGDLVRQVKDFEEDSFIFGRDTLPQDQEGVSDTFFFFDKEKGAFRTGTLFDSDYWAPDSLGNGSFAFGLNSRATSSYATAWGTDNRADGENATAWGEYNKALSGTATVWGAENEAKGEASTVWGTQNTTTGEYTTVFGENNEATQSRAVAWGQNNKAYGFNATVFGNNNQGDAENTTVFGGNNMVQGDYATAWGTENTISTSKITAWGSGNVASGELSTVFGESNNVNGYLSTVFGSNNIGGSGYETVIGRYATTYDVGSQNGWSSSDRLFSVGNGSGIARSNAFTLYKDGVTVINGSIAHDDAILDIQSDNRGILIPRLTTINRNNILTPPTGLLVFDSDLNSFWYYDGSAWVDLTSSGDNLGDHVATQNIELSGKYLSGDGDDEGILIDVNGNVGINKTPLHSLDVNGNVNATGLITSNFQLHPMGSSGNVLTSNGTSAVWQPGVFEIDDLEDGKTNWSNLFLGDSAGDNDNGNANYNTGVGESVLIDNVDGLHNTGLGAFSLWKLNGGSGNTAVGSSSLYDNNSGSNNTVIGTSAGHNAHGSGNIFIGWQSGWDEDEDNKLYIENSSSASPLIWGDFSSDNIKINGHFQVTGKFKDKDGDVGTNDQILVANAEGKLDWSDLSSVGANEIDDLTDGKTGGNSVFLGENTGQNDDGSDNRNTGLGINALQNNSTGEDNLAIGYNAMQANVEGGENTSFGNETLSSGTSSYQNAAFGHHALRVNTSDDNAAFGSYALSANTLGYKNTAVGRQSLGANTQGYANTSVGAWAMQGNETGTLNTALGTDALLTLTTGSNNTSLGSNSGYYNNGSNNVFIGFNAGYNETGSNKLYIENSNSSSPLIYGDFQYDYLRINGSLNVTDTLFDSSTDEGNPGEFLSTTGHSTDWIQPTISHLADGKALNYSTFLGEEAGANDDGSFNQNTALGYFAMNLTDSGMGNTAQGYHSMRYNTTGNYNTAIGNTAMQSNGGGSQNTALGNGSLFNNTSGNSNTAVGDNALVSNQTGGSNAAFGENALNSNNSGSFNVALGPKAGYGATGNFNVFIGNEAGYNETGDNKLYIDNSNISNPLIWGDFTTNEVKVNGSLTITNHLKDSNGYAADNGEVLFGTGSGNTWRIPEIGDLSDGITDENSTFLGGSAGTNDDLTNNYNTGLGKNSLYSNISGEYNTSIGSYALYTNTANKNTGIGAYTLYTNSSGEANTATGYIALGNNQTGNYNSAHGFEALKSNTTGSFNHAGGAFALNSNTVGNYNTATGYGALLSGTGSSLNTATGAGAMSANSSGSWNTATGAYALNANTSGNYNMISGYSSLALNQNGSYNTSLGSYALGSNVYGNSNTALGYQAGYNNVGSQNVFLGNQAGYSETGSNKLYIHNNSSTTPLIWGDFSSGDVKINGSLQVSSAIKDSYGNVGNNGQVLASNGVNATFWRDIPPGDNLGNHYATQDLNMANSEIALNGGYISGDGDDEGLTVNSSGMVGIGTPNPSQLFEVYGVSVGGAGHFTNTINNDYYGVYGECAGADFYGYGGFFKGGFTGVKGIVNPTGSSNYTGVLGVASGGSGNNYGIYGTASGSGTNYAGYFQGNVHVNGTLSKSSGSFKIDHPIYPATKYLNHSFVESPDMMNVYNGNITTNAQGQAEVELPEWFEALNKDFRYQLTVIGEFAQAIISEKVNNNRFSIKTDKPNVEVSWQITGIRQDKYAEAHRIQVEEDKKGNEYGKYLYPELYGKSKSMGIANLEKNGKKLEK